MARRRRLVRIYERMYAAFGPQHWWPGESSFEVLVGAMLTQNTAWPNVERAIANLAAADRLHPEGILSCPQQELARLVRPSGYYNVKARRLRALVDWYARACGGRIDRLRRAPLDALRAELLTVPGVGPETADSILLYAAGRPTFVIDAYTRRIAHRLDLADQDVSYEALRARFMDALPRDRPLYNEYHALLVRLGKVHCRVRPRCADCPLGREPHRAGYPIHATEEG